MSEKRKQLSPEYESFMNEMDRLLGPSSFEGFGAPSAQAPQVTGSLSSLAAAVPEADTARLETFGPHLIKAMQESGINTPQRQAAFLAQLSYESGAFKHTEELATGDAYEGRKDLGNTKAGDGRQYKGRGLIQLTGRENYRKAGQALGLDLENNPSLAADPEVAARVAAWYWNTQGLNELADSGDTTGITKRINGGTNGLADREKRYKTALSALTTLASTTNPSIQAPAPQPQASGQAPAAPPQAAAPAPAAIDPALFKELETLTPQRIYEIAASDGDKLNESHMGPVEKLLRSYDRPGLVSLVGPELAGEIQNSYDLATQRVLHQGSVDRTAVEATQDSLLTVVDASAGTVLSLSTLAAQVAPWLDNDSPLRTGEMLQDFRKFYDDAYSDPMKARQEVKSGRGAAAERNHQADLDYLEQYQAQKIAKNSDGSNLSEFADWVSAEAWKLSQDAVAAGKHTLDDPMLLSKGIVEGIASLGQAALAKNALTGLGRAAIGKAAARIEARALASGVEKSLAKKLADDAALKFAAKLETGAVSGAVGLTEGVGAYGSTLTDVLSRDPADLLKTSEDYRKKVSDLETRNQSENLGLSRSTILERARAELAQDTALSAAAGTGVVSAAIGHLLPEGVLSPVKVASKGRNMVIRYLKDAGKETIEEAGQGAAGQVAGNLAKQAFVDPNQDLTEGVGRAIGEGGVLGGLVSGTLKAPSAITGTTRMGLEGAKLFSEVTASKKIAKLEEESRTSAKNLTTETEAFYADTSKDEMLGKLALQAFDDQNVDEVGRIEGNKALQGLMSAPIVSELPASISSLDPELQKKFAPKMFRVTAINEAAQAFNKETDVEAKKNLVSVLFDLLEPVDQYKQTPTALEPLHGNAEAKQLLSEYQSILGNIRSLPEVKKATAGIEEFLGEILKNSKSEAVEGDLESQTTAKFLATQAQQDPTLSDAGVTSDQVDKMVLAHGASGDNSLTETQRKILETSSGLLQAREAVTKKADPAAIEKMMDAHLDGGRTVESVAQQATVNQDEKYAENKKFSVRQHMGRIIDSALAGRTKEAQLFLKRLGNFAQSHNNKVAALNESYGKGGKKFAYQQFVPSKNEFMDSATSGQKHPLVGVKKNNPKSVAFAQTVDLEADLITRSYNELAQAFPELGLEPIEQVLLHPDLQPENAQKAAAAPQTKTQTKAPKETPKEAPKTESKPKPQATKKKEAPKKPAKKESESTAKPESSKAQKPVKEPVPVRSSKASEKILAQKEAEIADKKVEHGVVIDPASGKILWEGTNNDSAHISVPSSVAQENTIFTHNHPTPEGFHPIAGARLSPGDVISTIKNNRQEVRAVTADGSVSRLVRPAEGWNPKPGFERALRTLEEDYAKKDGDIQTAARKRMDDVILAAGGDPKQGSKAKGWSQELWSKFQRDAMLEAINQYAQRSGQKWRVETIDAKVTSTETVSTEVETDQKTKASTVKEFFQNLHQVPGKIRNYFVENFNFRKGTTRLASVIGAPLDAVWNALLSEEAFKTYMGDAHKNHWTQDLASAYLDILEDRGLESERNIGALLAHLQNNLDTFLASTWQGDVTFDQALREGRIEANVMFRGKALNLLELDPETNKFKYNEALAQQAALAGIQWQIAISQISSFRKPDQILKLLGITDPNVTLNSKMVKALATGISGRQAQITLSKMIERFWGVQADTSAPMGLSTAISEAFSAEIIRALEDSKFLNKEVVHVHKLQPSLNITQTINQYHAYEWDKKNEIYSHPDLIEEMVLTEPERRSFYDDDKVPTKSTQAKNSKVKISRKNIKALNNEQNQKFFLNMPLVEIMESLDDEDVVRGFGSDLSDETRFNKNDYDARVSKNLALTGAMTEFRRLLLEMRNVSKSKGLKSIGELGKKFQFFVGSNGRHMMQGAYNPQSNKLMRELLLSTWSTLDLANPVGPHRQFFMIALAQALGEKIHKKTLEANVAWSETAILEGGVAHKAIQVLEDHLEDVETAKSKNAEPPKFSMAKYIVALDGKLDNSPLVMMALLEVARMNRLEQTDPSSLKAFRTPLYLEADGMTNGPFNAMGLLSMGMFTPEWVQKVRKGGLNFGRRPSPVEELLADGDLYQMAAEGTQAKIVEQRNSYNEDALHFSNQLLRAMSVLLPKDVTWDESTQTFSFKRGLLKGPMTQMTYGAGIDALARGVSSRMLKEFYSILSKIAVDPSLQTKYQPMLDAMGELANVDGTIPRRLKNVRAFTLSEDEKSQLTETLKYTLMDSVQEAITETVGSTVVESGKTLVQATQMMAGVAQILYSDLIKKKLEAKAAAFEAEGMEESKAKIRASTEFLSPAELDEVWNELADALPMVSIDDQNFLIAKEALLTMWDSKTKKTKSLPKYNRALNDELGEGANLEVISNPGVSAIPMMNIGMGDARMVREIFQTAMEGAFQVYDGVNLPIDKITEYGSRINEAALHAWQGNVFKGVLESFEKFLNHPMVVEGLKNSDVRMRVVKDVHFGKNEKGKRLTPEQGLRDMQAKLARSSMMMQSRQIALSKVALSMGQMAGTYRPFVAEGIDIPEGASDQDIADLLNVEARKAWLEIQAGKDPQPDARREVEQESDFDPVLNEYEQSLFAPQQKPEPQSEPVAAEVPADLVEILGKAATRHEESGASVVSAKNFQTLPKALKDVLTDSEQGVLTNMVKSPLMKGVTLVTGSLEELLEYEKSQDSSELREYINKNPNRDLHGLYAPGSKTIYLIDPQVETLVHELVHAATYQTVHAYFSGDREVRGGPAGEAIRRLQDLMKLFLEGEDFGLDPESDAAKALRDAQNEINRHRPLLDEQTPAQKAAALNEFMAWTLANRELAEQLDDKDSSLTARLGRITKAAWNAIKKLIWRGRRASPGAGEGRGVLDRIRIYTSVVARNPVSLQKELHDIGLAHSTLAGTEEPTRLSRILEAFGTMVARHLGQKDVSSKELQADPKTARAFELAQKMGTEAGVHFQDMSDLELSTFRMMVMALTTEARISPHSLTEAAKLYEKFLKVVELKDFLKDPETNDPTALDDARKKLAFLAGQGLNEKDKFGRSTTLPVFIALATVSDEFRQVLAKYDLLGNQEASNLSGPDAVLETVGSKMLRSLEKKLSGATDRSANMKDAVDLLTHHVTEEALKARTAIDNLVESVRHTSHGVNGKLVNLMQRTGGKARIKSEALAQSNSKLDKALSRMLSLAALMASEKDGNIVAESELARQDKNHDMKTWIRELMGSDGLIGRVGSQAKIYDMYKKVRATVAQTRQVYREHIPHIINSKFKIKPTEQQYDLLYRHMGRSDLAVLISANRSVSQVLALASDSNARKQELSKLKAELRSIQTDPKNAARIEAKIDQLVNYMQTGIMGTNLLRNAYAISELLGEPKNEKTWVPSTEHMAEVIDQIATLQYLEKMSAVDQRNFTQLLKDEPEAIEFTLNYLQGQRAGEISKAKGGRARFNHHKGELPSETNKGHLVVVHDDEHARMTLLGYTRTGRYAGSSIESRTGSYSYYYSPEGGSRTRFNQGLIQNVQGTAYGIHSATGFSMRPNAGYITDPDKVEALVQQLNLERGASKSPNSPWGKENLSPVYDTDGRVMAFERSLDPKQLELIQKPQHLGRMIGHWRGRQVEEAWAQEINSEVVRHLADMYEKDKNTPDKDRYTNLFDDKRPVIKDAVSLLSKEVREELEAKFGEGNFPVRENLVNQIVGYRNASIGDMWTGNTNVSDEFQEVVKKSLITLLGTNAYRKVMWMERNWQAVTGAMRTNIVVRSVTVSVANIISGLYQLKARGVPLVIMAREIPKKFAELEHYTKTMAEVVALEAEFHADPVRAAKVKGLIQSKKDSLKRLTIWPLIEAGEFSSIANVGMTGENFGETEGTIIEQLEQAVDKLPDGVKTIAKYGYIAKDTALFRALQKSVQYSDFVMKAVYYDHVLKHEHEFLERTPGYQEALNEAIDQIFQKDPVKFTAKGLVRGDPRLLDLMGSLKLVSPKEIEAVREKARVAMAKGRIIEEFNNYDLPTGRTRGYLESIGLAWFLNYKIRAAKIGLSMFRNNPLDLLLYMALPHPMSGGIPVTDNMFARLFEGSLGNALGPGMLVEPIAWNSWYNLFDS